MEYTLILGEYFTEKVTKYGIILVHNDIIECIHNYDINKDENHNDIEICTQEKIDLFLQNKKVSKEKVKIIILKKNELLLPGLIDSHIHPFAAMLHELKTPSVDCLELNDCIKLIKQHIEENPNKEWYFFKGYSPNIFNEQNQLSYSLLDKICSTKPIVVIRFDMHAWWVNTKAMEVSKIDYLEKDGTMQNPIGGKIERDNEGKINGEFSDNAMSLISSHAPITNKDEKLVILEKALNRLLDLGITTFMDACVKYDMLELYLKVYSDKAKIDFLPRTALAIGAQKINVFPECLGITPLKDIDKKIESNKKESLEIQYKILTYIFDNFRVKSWVNEQYQNKLQVNFVKLFIDGVYESYTAYIHQKYQKCSCEEMQQGNPCFNEEELTEMFEFLLSRGLNIHCHTIGDKAISMTLNSIEQAKKIVKISEYNEFNVEKNNLIEKSYPKISFAHIQVCQPEDIIKFKKNNIGANFSPLWIKYESFTEEFHEIIGQDNIKNVYPVKSIKDLGISCGFGSDWPVSSENPWYGIQSAVTHEDILVEKEFDKEDEKVYLKNQLLTVGEAIECYTKGSAELLEVDKYVGTIEEGKFADLIIINQNIMKEGFDLRKIYKTQINLLMINGKVIRNLSNN